MIQIQTLNAISPVYRDSLPEGEYDVRADAEHPQALLVRSANLHEMSVEDELLCIGRAGAGVNNIPLDKMAETGVVVFNSPGRQRQRRQGAGRRRACCWPRAEVIDGVEWCKTLAGKERGQWRSWWRRARASFAGPELSGQNAGRYRPGRHRRAGGQRGRGAGHGCAGLRPLHLGGSRLEALPRRAPFQRTLPDEVLENERLSDRCTCR